MPHASPSHALSLALTHLLCSDAQLLATASVKGTLLRVWSSAGQLLHELRRGIDVAAILSISFSASSAFLACSSDKGTVHVFSLAPSAEQPVAPAASANKHSYLKRLVPGFLVPRGLGGFLDSEWSFLQLRGLGKCIVAFSRDGAKLLVLCASGVAYTYAFTPEGKSCRESTTKFVGEGSVGRGDKSRVALALTPAAEQTGDKAQETKQEAAGDEL